MKQCNTAPQHTAVKKNNDLSELSSEPIYRKNKEVWWYVWMSWHSGKS